MPKSPDAVETLQLIRLEVFSPQMRERRGEEARFLRVSAAMMAFAFVLFVAACGAQRIRVYSGPERPRDRVATVSGFFDRDRMMVTIETLDGRKVAGQGPFRGGVYSRDTVAEIIPGYHEAEVRFWGFSGTTTMVSDKPLFVAFVAQAGRDYEIRVRRFGDAFYPTAPSVVPPSPWLVWVVDTHSGEPVQVPRRRPRDGDATVPAPRPDAPNADESVGAP
jgi:hypothetical protein